MAKNYGRVKAFDPEFQTVGHAVQWRYKDGPDQAWKHLFNVPVPQDGVTETEVQVLIAEAINNLPPSGLTETQVQTLIAEAIAVLPHGDGLTEGEVIGLIDAALADIEGLDPADLISDEDDNALELCTQGKLFVPASKSFTHTQTVPATQWSIQHNLQSLFVSVVTVDSDGNEVIGFVDRVNSTANLLIMQFSQPIAGSAYIRL